MNMMGYIVKPHKVAILHVLRNVTDLGAGEMAPWVMRLLCKHQDLSSDPQHPHKSWVWLHASVTLALGVRDRQVPGARQPTRLDEKGGSGLSEKFCLKENKGGEKTEAKN